MTTPRGAFGLEFVGSLVLNEPVQKQLVPVVGHWPGWAFQWERLDTRLEHLPHAAATWSEYQCTFAAQPSGFVSVERDSATTTLHLVESPTPAALVHPYFASTSMVVNQWLGRMPFHAGAFVHAGRAWAVLGGREMGKSSLIMSLHQAGVTVLTDDLMVLDGETAYAGPRCLDLRESAADRFDAGEFLGVIGTRERWRVQLPAAPSEVPFGGWVLLDWGDEVSMTLPTPTDRLAALAVHRAAIAAEADSAQLLELLRFPMYRFTRPFEWGAMDNAIEQLLEAL
jgi:hypothetical protein